jgi:phosphoadenosine phosphosulfate reductase
MVRDSRINGFYHSKEARLACCNVRKVEPLGRALAGAAAWVTGLRADQSGERASVPLAGWDAERALVKFAPLFDWTRERVAAACAELGVPVNPLHADGYLSIGCEPCTRALRPGEPERAGRWWWENDEARECGLHVGPGGRLVRAKAAA